MLKEGKGSNFVTVKEQLYDKLQADYGNQASFIETGIRWIPEPPTMDEIDSRYPDTAQKIKDNIFGNRVGLYEKTLDRLDQNYARIYGTIKQILENSVKDKVQRSEGFSEAKTESDPVKLWKIVTNVIGMQCAVGDPTEAKQNAKLLYQAEQMSTSEDLLSFYRRLKFRYENCILLEVKDIPDQEGAARDFYSKLDAGKYGSFYREKRNNVKRNMENGLIFCKMLTRRSKHGYRQHGKTLTIDQVDPQYSTLCLNRNTDRLMVPGTDHASIVAS